MVIKRFPSVDLSDERGLLAIGGDLDMESLKLAYQNGIFPWPVGDQPILWFAPPLRAILEFCDFKIPKRFQRDLKKINFKFKVNCDFKEVITKCSQSDNRSGQKGTWITKDMIQAYTRLYNEGLALSFEAYNKDEKLVGGMYGVSINKFFAGESMFYLESNASKFVLVQTVEYLKKEGFEWIDIQMLTPLLKSFGAKEISRHEYMKKLKQVV